jgi:hypothetical protein
VILLQVYPTNPFDPPDPRSIHLQEAVLAKSRLQKTVDKLSHLLSFAFILF